MNTYFTLYRTFTSWLVFLVLSASAIRAQVDMKIQLLDPELAATATLDQDRFIAYVSEANDAIESVLNKAKGNFDAIVLFTFRLGKAPRIELKGNPELPEKIKKELRSRLKKLNPIEASSVDYTMGIVGRVNAGGEGDGIIPARMVPRLQRLEAYAKLDLPAKKEALQLWLEQWVLPLLTHYERKANPEFAGVLAMGKVLEEGKYRERPVEALTRDNHDYWRAMMEMEPGNQLIPFTKAVLHLIQGQFDRGKRYLELIPLFSEEGSLPDALMDELGTRLDLLMKDLNAAIRDGIKLHDAGKYDEAIAHYNKLLKDFPGSAWLNYEWYFSTAAKEGDLERSMEEWNRFKKVVYACDPLYAMGVKAQSGKEGYRLFRRQEAQALFEEKGKLKQDLLTYGDIALDLEDYAFAAQMYWWLLTHVEEGAYPGRDLLHYYLYCLEQMEHRGIRSNFKGDWPEIFKLIAGERQTIMEESPVYQAFERDE